MRTPHRRALTLVGTWLLLSVACSNSSVVERGPVFPPLSVLPNEPTLASLLGERGRIASGTEAAAAFGSLQSKGVGRLTVDSLEVKVQIEGRLARTEVTQVFRNHQSRQLEGTYRFTLPDGAAIARLAMDVNGQMMEGELVEKEKARRIFESIVRKKKDPALLEWEGGNRFKTRIFPIPARGTKTIVLAYEQVLPQRGRSVRYRYSLPTLVGEKDPERIGKFTFSLRSGRAEAIKVSGYDATVSGSPPVATFAEDAFIPRGPLEVDLAGPWGESGSVVSKQLVGAIGQEVPEYFFAASFVPSLAAAAKAEGDLVFAIDSSASVGDVELSHALVLALQLAREHTKQRQVMAVFGDVKAFACALDPWSAGAAAEVAIAKCLQERMARGASDLSALIGAGFQAAAKLDHASVVLMSDGQPSLGEMDADLLIAQVARGAKKSGSTLHTVAIGHNPDEELLLQLARGGEGHSVRLKPSVSVTGVAETIKYLLGSTLITDIAVEVIGGSTTEMIAPPRTIARGEPALVLGRLRGEYAKLKLTGQYKGQTIEQEVVVNKKQAIDAPIVMRFWARKQIEVQTREKKPRAEIVASSIKYGVMSPYTSYLVLENERMYQQNAIERRKKAERATSGNKRGQKNVPKAFRKGTGRLQDLFGAKDDKASPTKTSSAKTRTVRSRKEAKAERAPSPPTAAAPMASRPTGLADEEAEPEALGKVAASGSARSAKKVAKRKSGRAEGSFEQGTFGRGSADRGSSSRGMESASGSRFSGVGSGGVGSGGGGVARGGVANSLNSILATGAPTDREEIGGLAAQEKPSIKKMPRGSVLIDHPAITGPLSAGAVRNVLLRRRSSFAKCFSANLQQGAASPKFTANFEVDIRGRTTASTRRQLKQIQDPGEMCVLKSLLRLRFPSARSLSKIKVLLTWTKAAVPPRFLIEKELVPLKQAFKERSKLSRAGQMRLLRSLLRAKKRRDAKRTLKTVLQATKKMSAHDRLDLVMKTLLVRNSYPNDHLALVAATLADSSTTVGDLERLAPSMNLARSAKLADALHDKALAPTVAVAAIKILHADVRLERAPVLVTSWEESGGLKGRGLLSVVWPSHGNKAFAARALDVATQLIDEGQGDAELLTVIEAAANEIGKPQAATDALLEVCRLGKVPGRKCLELSRQGEVSEADRLLFILLARRDVVEQEDLITLMATQLQQMGALHEAMRVQSEVVEFSPRDIARRRRYFYTLRKGGEPVAACAQGATLVQLRPAERDMFRHMMDLVRNWPAVADDIKRCITEGVSMLPVRRSISVIMTWEDDAADIDLHISEPNNQRVNFSSRQSSNGGLLYYDVRNGLGPEIYTLGKAAKGEYKIGVVYYGGDSKNVPVTVTLLRNAGAPDETREVFDITLDAQDPESAYWLTDFSL